MASSTKYRPPIIIVYFFIGSILCFFTFSLSSCDSSTSSTTDMDERVIDRDTVGTEVEVEETVVETDTTTVSTIDEIEGPIVPSSPLPSKDENEDGLPDGEDINEEPTTNGSVVKIEVEEALIKAYNLVEGRIAIAVPERMYIDSTYRVEVALTKSQGEDDAEVTIEMQEADIAKVESIKLTSSAVVELKDDRPEDDKAFSIKQLHQFAEQPVDGTSNTIWSWFVTPIKSGTYPLHVVVNVRVKGKDGDATHRMLPTYDRQIFVDSSWYVEAKKFSVKNWQWLIAVIVSPLFVWLGNIVKAWYDKRQQNKHPRRPAGF